MFPRRLWMSYFEKNPTAENVLYLLTLPNCPSYMVEDAITYLSHSIKTNQEIENLLKIIKPFDNPKLAQIILAQGLRNINLQDQLNPM